MSDARKREVQTFNGDAFMRGIILFGFITLLIWLSITEQLPLYINPNFSILIEISCFLLIPMFTIQILDFLIPINSMGDEHHCHTHTGPCRYIPFLTILVLAFALPDNTLKANLVSNRGLNSQINTVVTSTQVVSRPLAPTLREMKLIQVSDLNYTEAISEITGFPQDYIGKKVTMTGFVFRSPGLANNQLSLVRYVILCCTADTLPYGVMCEVPDAKKYPDGSWLSIEGIVQMGTYKNENVAAIKITSAKQISEPKKPYIFPYN